MNLKDLNFIAEKTGKSKVYIKNIVSLLEEEITVPFIARYRKEVSGSMNEVEIQEIKELFDFINELNSRKKTIVKTIESQGKLSAELKNKIKTTYSKNELEDIYLPFKPKKRTKATIAKEKGLEPFAALILNPGETEDINILAKKFVSEKRKVFSVEEAIEGAGFIIAENFSENLELRRFIRKLFFEKGVWSVNVTKNWKGKRSKYEQYYEFEEPVRKIPSHRILAIRRGEKEGVLKSSIKVSLEEAVVGSYNFFYNERHPRKELLDEFLRDSLKRLVFPSIELEVRSELKSKADKEAMKVFSKNLEQLLLFPPAGELVVMGVDPGFRTGCKIVVLDRAGKVLEHTTIYPVKPHEKIDEAKEIVLRLYDKYKIEAVAIGNGTASRETADFFKSIFKEKGVIVSVVNEVGASVYSTSKTAREEFPDYDVTVRGAISIGRRFQDPLAELVKIEPKSIGVGQYQHDVNQKLLKKKLDETVVSVVNRVGVDLNTTSYHLLKYVSGIGSSLAKNIVKYRDKNGRFEVREELLKVKGMGEKAYELSVGFLRIRKGKNILDSTGIHPETYFIVEKMANSLDVKIDNLIGSRNLIEKIQPELFTTREFGLLTIIDIIKELKERGREPRKEFELFEFDESVKEFEDVEEGMVLKGVITNITNFGVFVDIGVHQDGLIHISELSHEFVKNPEDIVSVGEKVTVKVLSVDKELKRISLSLKALENRPTRIKKKKNKDPISELKKMGS